jgi:hypothetical protein
VEPLSDEEARKSLKRLMDKGGRRVAIAMCVDGNEARDVFDNGTVSFVQIGGEKFILTNHHVWEAFEEYRKDSQSCRLAIGGDGLAQPIDISDAEVIDVDSDLDICVLRYPSERIENVGKEYCIVDSWPPRRASEGDDVVFCGFPGNRAKVSTMQTPRAIEDQVFAHELVLLSMRVESQSDRKLRMCFSEEKPEVQQFSSYPIQDYIWGGMSGSLVYRLDSTEIKLVPCAIFHSSSGELDGAFYATHLDLVNKNGTLNRSV